MRQVLAVALTGLIAGTAGALLAVRMTANRAPAPAPSFVAASGAPAIVVPPGWDSHLSERLAALEQSTAARGAAVVVPAPSAAPPAPDPESRRQELQEKYQDALDHQAQLVREHEAEPLDRAWSSAQAAMLEERFIASSAQMHLAAARVDCRTHSCVARLTFPRATDALHYLREGQIPATDDCRGMVSTPAPPRGDGEYELTVVLLCRQ